MSKGTIGQLPLLYKKNEMNDLFTLQYIFDFGANEMKTLGTARDYLDYLGTSDMTAAEVKQAFYNLACSYRISVGNTQVTINLSGLSENMSQAIELLEKEWLKNALARSSLFTLRKQMRQRNSV